MTDLRPRSPRARNLAAAVLRLILLPARLMAARAVLAQLAALDGRELADIGLSRSDLRDATALARGADPTHFLAERAGDRRASAERLRAPPPSRRARPRLAKTGS
jgi:uncharacterized protein YjiS (DUF1127 family)